MWVFLHWTCIDGDVWTAWIFLPGSPLSGLPWVPWSVPPLTVGPCTWSWCPRQCEDRPQYLGPWTWPALEPPPPSHRAGGREWLQLAVQPREGGNRNQSPARAHPQPEQAGPQNPGVPWAGHCWAQGDQGTILILVMLLGQCGQ